jgi:hypothetical protein
MSNLLVYEATEAGANDVITARYLAEAILKAYPGHLWAVHVDGEQGIWWIKNLSLSGNWGWMDKLGRVYSASSMVKDALHHAGEILERYNQPRGAFSGQHWAELCLDMRGVPVGDKSPSERSVSTFLPPRPPSQARPLAYYGTVGESQFEREAPVSIEAPDPFEVVDRDH